MRKGVLRVMNVGELRFHSESDVALLGPERDSV